MKKIDINWAKSQLEQEKVTPEVGIAVVKLLEFWPTLEHSDQADEKVLEVFSRLARSIALVDDNKNEIWEPARPGFLKVGDEVRVKADAFDGELGQMHNGRRGKIVGVRYGDIIIKTTDGKEPVLDGSHYSPFNLDKLVAVL
jgi:hypothetical protein